MRLETFFEKFDLFADAPNAVAKMRELVLELAVQGKLVPQNRNDEPAKELIKRIENAQRHTINRTKGKKLELLQPIEPDDFPHELPEGWEWCRLGTLGVIGSSCRVHQKDWTTSGVPFLRAREIVKLSKLGLVENDLFISEEHFQRLAKEGLIPAPNDLMITGVGTIGVPYVVKDTDRFYFKDASVLIFKNRFGLYPHYLHTVMQSPYWIREVHRESMGTTVHTLTIVRANSTPIPLPPLAEQKRIVAKVDELMALCDRLEAQQQERDTRHAALARASLSRFAEAPTPANLDFLFHKSYPITPADLRKSILTLAVQGKLVPQDANDAPVCELLEKLAQAKTLAKKGKSSRGNISNTFEIACPYEAPEGWAWVPLNNIGVVSGGMTPSKAKAGYWGGDMNWFSPKDIKSDELIDSELKITSAGVEATGLQVYPAGCLFMVARSGILKRTFPVSINRVEATANQDLKVLTPFISGMERYLQIMFRGMTDFILASLVKTGMTVQSLKYEEFEAQVFPLPPLAEQRRIVAKADQLMALVDQLETQLVASRATAEELMEALVYELTGSSGVCQYEQVAERQATRKTKATTA